MIENLAEMPEIKFYNIQNAVPEDTWQITHLINHFSTDGSLVPIEGKMVYKTIGDFIVAKEDGKIIGCGALAVYRKDIAELRSVCVVESRQKRGVGRDIVRKLMDRALDQNISDVVIITKVPEFWEKMGFFPQGDNGRHIRIRSMYNWDHGERRSHP